jgi:hypothetical protein
MGDGYSGNCVGADVGKDSSQVSFIDPSISGDTWCGIVTTDEDYKIYLRGTFDGDKWTNVLALTTAPEPDTDSDGVIDSDDQCADTPAGETVDSQGCGDSQKDTDADGVNDSADQCPDTPSSDTADAEGCGTTQKDTDSDGVKDNFDQCPATPAGESADKNGCGESQRDTDRDGINDDVDPFKFASTMATEGAVTLTTTPALATSDCSITEFGVENGSTDGIPGLTTESVGVIADFTLWGVNCSAQGAESINIALDLGTVLPPGARAYKITADDVWEEIPGATIKGSVISYTITDNGPLDQDDNLGFITDPVTAAVPLAQDATPVPALPFFGLLSLGGLLGLLGLRKLRY